MKKLQAAAHRNFRLVAMMSFLVFGCSGLVGMGEPDVKAHLKQDFMNRSHDISIRPNLENKNAKVSDAAYEVACRNLSRLVANKIDDMISSPKDFDFQYIHPRNTKSV